MRFLLIILVALAAIFLWRSSRRGDVTQMQQKKPLAALEMVQCKFCSVHVPAQSAVEGKAGWYCSAEHRQRAEL